LRDVYFYKEKLNPSIAVFDNMKNLLKHSCCNNIDLIQMGSSESSKYVGESIFVLCETCHWSATCFDKSKIDNEKCIICGNIAISTFPILPNEEFAFNYSDEHGIEPDFGIRKSKNKNDGKQ
jgi:ribosomal protein S27E